MKRVGLILFLVLAQATTACNSAKTTNSGTVAKQKVGAKGGSLTLGTGVSLQVPPGALASEVELGVEEVTGNVEGFTLGSKRYRFTPAGTTFAVPVVVSLEQTTPADSQSIFWTKAGGAVGYDKLATAACGKSTAGKDLFCGSTSHFSEGFLGTENGPAPLVCTQGQTKCGETCVDLQTSTANCGACGTVCSGTQVCGAGACAEPVRTVTVRVQELAIPSIPPPPQNPTRAENAVITFVGRKVGSTWQSLAVATGAGMDARTYTFTTQELSYEVAVGCAFGAESTGYRVHYFNKSVIDNPEVSVTCGYPPAPSPEAPPTYIDIQPQLTGTDQQAIGSARYITTLGSQSCAAFAGEAQSCEIALAPNEVYDVVYGNEAKLAVRRGITPSGPSPQQIDLPLSELEATRSATLVVGLGQGRTVATFESPLVVRGESEPFSRLYLATSRGKFSQELQTFYSDEVADEAFTATTLTFTTSSVLAAGDTQTDDKHYLETTLFEAAVEEVNSNVEWIVEAVIQGNVSTETPRNVTLPNKLQYTFDDATGAITGLSTAGSVSAEAEIERGSLRWFFDIDAAAVPSGSTYPLSAQDLSAIIADEDEAYYAIADNEGAISGTTEVRYRQQDATITAFLSHNEK